MVGRHVLQEVNNQPIIIHPKWAPGARLYVRCGAHVGYIDDNMHYADDWRLSTLCCWPGGTLNTHAYIGSVVVNHSALTSEQGGYVMVWVFAISPPHIFPACLHMHYICIWIIRTTNNTTVYDYEGKNGQSDLTTSAILCMHNICNASDRCQTWTHWRMEQRTKWMWSSERRVHWNIHHVRQIQHKWTQQKYIQKFCNDTQLLITCLDNTRSNAISTQT